MDVEEEIYKPIEICSLVDKKYDKEFHQENFFKGCKWAPDGTCLLTNSNDNFLRTFDLPSELHCKNEWRPSKGNRPKLNYTLKIKEGGVIYDFVWYPKMNSMENFTSYFLCSSMYAPIHLWDSVGGEIKATYRPYNQVDEVTHAYSLAFSPDGSKIHAGLLSEVKIFSTDIPGRQCVSRNLKPWFGKSIVSAIAINSIVSDICAIGTYSKTIGLFSESDGKPLFFLKGHKGGITKLEFSSDGILLFSGARMDSEILCWDLRNPGCVLYSFPRDVSTNQRVYFDLTSCSNYLLSGNTTGDVSIWSLNSNLPTCPYEESPQEPLYKFSAHQDCTNGVSVHPYYPILGTTSGQRHVLSAENEDSLQQLENDLKLWWIGR
uniref:WD repeat-containing protein 79 n=1 Tax=Cacopsylla melanoneura TaxID=428564 RepID=A0A8D8U321_9HEMI